MEEQKSPGSDLLLFILLRLLRYIMERKPIDPLPMQLVVVRAVRAAVRAATIIFTSVSIQVLLLFISFRF